MRKLPLSVLLLAPLVALGIYACDQGGPAEPELNVADQQLDGLLVAHVQNGNPFVGSWRLTSAVTGSEEVLVGSGLEYIGTFRSDGTHSVSVSNDVDHLVCPAQTSCEWDGTYTYTGTIFTTVEPNHPSGAAEYFGLYALCGGKAFLLEFGDDDVGKRQTWQRTGLGR